MDGHQDGGTDLPVTGDGYMLFGKPVNYLRASSFFP